MITYYS